MANKYEEGVKLRYEGVYGHYFTNGVIYEVDCLTEDFVYVIDDNNDQHGMTPWYIDDYFEIVSESPKYCCSACGKQLGEVALGGRHGGGSYCSNKCVESAEPTPVEASPTVIELLANISRRLYEAEKEITELNEKQAIFFDIDKLMKIRIFDLERQNRVQAYEINELYKAVAERG